MLDAEKGTGTTAREHQRDLRTSGVSRQVFTQLELFQFELRKFFFIFDNPDELVGPDVVEDLRASRCRPEDTQLADTLGVT